MKAFVLFLMMIVGGVSSAFAGTESFRQTCNIQYEDRYEVRAYCRDTHGGSVYNVYRKTYCAGDVANLNGYITCYQGGGTPDHGGGGGYPGGWLPNGSYQQTCYDCNADGYTLSCSCQAVNGQYRYTSLRNYNTCRGDIANLNGRLSCR